MIPGIESVFAELILALISSVESVIRMRDFSDLWDLDILEVGSLSDITLWTGAILDEYEILIRESEAHE